MTEAAKPGRFVVLHHMMPCDDARADGESTDGEPTDRESASNARPDHWDLMIEAEHALWTWELLELPVADRPQIVRRLPDHRKHYLDYEGPISGNRGHVRRWDSGQCHTVLSDPEENNAPQKLVVSIQGQLIGGDLHLTRLSHTLDGYQLLLQTKEAK